MNGHLSQKFPFYIFDVIFKMSLITANNSLVDYEARTKSNSRHFRNYQRVSDSNLDQSSIAAYLRSRHLHKTLSTFISQCNRKKTVTPILDIFNRGGQNYTGSAQQYWKLIQKAIEAKNVGISIKEMQVKKAKMTKLQLYIYIWHCITDNEINPQRVNVLKQFITAKGSTLSQSPELLPYFVLPYVQKIGTHSFLKKVLSEGWKNEVRSLLSQLIGVEAQAETMEQEWFNIITDLIDICEHLAKQVRIDMNSIHLKAMVQRVKLYKTVVQKNQIEQRLVFQQNLNKKEQQVKGEIQINLNNMKLVKGRLIQLNELLIQNRNNNTLAQTMKIYHKIGVEISQRHRKGTDKQYISQLIENDILLLKGKACLVIMQLEWLKLLQIMSPYYKCRSYLVQNHYVISKIAQLIEKWYIDNKATNRLQLFYMGFDIIQKLIIRRELFQIINNNQIIAKVAIDLIRQYQYQFQRSKQASILFEVLLVWVVNTVMHRKGRSKISKMGLFQTLVSILSRLPNMDNSLTIQSLICSIIYLLLVQHQIRLTAVKLKLKEILLDRMMNKKNESYDSIVQYIIQRIENNEDEEEIDSDQDVEKQQQFDENVPLCLQDLRIKDSSITALTSKDRNTSAVHKQQKKRQQYKSERYSWKKDK